MEAVERIPRLVTCGGITRLLVEDRPFTILGGELHNSSASSISYLEPILNKMKRCNLNTVLLPISWELLEPQEGVFDYDLVDGMVNAARKYGLRLVPLWFGTMKNAISSYVPEWVKTDLNRFPRAETTPGTPSWTVSPFGKEILAADARAFAKLMAHIREIDGGDHTIIMMQVENESGILNAVRDYLPLADAAFAEPVPEILMTHLDSQRDLLHPELAMAWYRGGNSMSGSWTEVFSKDAEEVFMAWHIASFTGVVAAAGRQEYDLPMFANTWLCGGPGFPPGKYPSGGPVAKMLDVWRAAAPHIDFISPDIYRPDFRDYCRKFSANGNALFVPEARNTNIAAANALYVIGKHRGLGFSPFAIDDIKEDHPLVETYAELDETLNFVHKHCPDAAMTAFVQEGDEESWEENLGGYTFAARTVAPVRDLDVPGSAMLINIGKDEFLCLGRNLIMTMSGPSGMPAEILALDVGSIENTEWVHGRRLNGDETHHGTGVLLRSLLTTYRFRVFCPR